MKKKLTVSILSVLFISSVSAFNHSFKLNFDSNRGVQFLTSILKAAHESDPNLVEKKESMRPRYISYSANLPGSAGQWPGLIIKCTLKKSGSSTCSIHYSR